jgi:hypothetical protein
LVLRKKVVPTDLMANVNVTCNDAALVASTHQKREALSPLALGVASGLHVAASVEHRTALVTAAFFGVVAIAQLASAVVLARRPTMRVRAGVAAFTVGMLVLWLGSRTTGVPGVHGGESHGVGALDVITALAELTALFGLVWCRRSFDWRPMRDLLGVVVVGAIAVGVGLPTATHDHDHRSGHPPVHAAPVHADTGGERIDVPAPSAATDADRAHAVAHDHGEPGHTHP